MSDWRGMPEPDPDFEDPGIPENAHSSHHLRHAAGTLIIWSCFLLDFIPWHDGRWYLRGQRGCAWGVSSFGFKVYGDD